MNRQNGALGATAGSKTIHSPTETYAESLLYYSERISMVERAAKMADGTLSSYILEAVTKELSYDYLKAKLDIPCCRDVYYELYHKFFHILSQTQN